jgi:MOSC domain-containing protein YiiM
VGAEPRHSGSGELVAINLAQVIQTPPPVRGRRDVKPTRTGIDKRPARGPVSVRRLGVVGDTICDTKNHGGLDQAVYAYAEEDADWWREQLADELSFALRPGAFGENLTTRGIDVTGAVIGERWRIGSTILQVSAPRIPCSTFAAFWRVDRLIKRFTAAGRPGAYLRVLTEGQLSAGDPIVVLDRPGHGLTIEQAFRGLTGDRSLAPLLAAAPELPAEARQQAQLWVATAAR